MYKRLRINDRQENIWICGCLHIFHRPEFIWKKRGFNSIQEHVDGVAHIINEFVKPTDTLIVLGDGFLNATDELVTNWWNRINCLNVKYIFGNHESCMGRLYKNAVFAKYNENIEVYPFKILPNVEILGNYIESYINGQDITFSHFPLAIWNNSHHLAWNLHSHNHGSFAASLPDCPAPKRLDCGWDVLKRPYNMREIKDIMSRKNLQILDHHQETTT